MVAAITDSVGFRLLRTCPILLSESKRLSFERFSGPHVVYKGVILHQGLVVASAVLRRGRRDDSLRVSDGDVERQSGVSFFTCAKV